MLERARSDLGPEAVIEVNNDLLESLTCPTCNVTQSLLASLGRVTESEGRCPDCDEPRTPNLYHTIGDRPELLEHSLAELGVPRWDIVGARAGLESRYYEFAGDRSSVLGELEHAPHQSSAAD